MKAFNRFRETVCDLLVLASIAGVIVPPRLHAQNDPAEVEEGGSRGRGDERRADPCALMADPSGKAEGHENKCPGGGSSSGIAKGDFNGDGFADLAVGVPDENVGAIVDAGAVNVIYGSEEGLTTDTAVVPAVQILHLSTSGVPGVPAAEDRFGTALAAGDFDADGFSDLAIGIPNKDLRVGDTTLRESGAVVVIYGSSDGLTATDPGVPAPQYMDMHTAGLDDIHGAEGAHFGASLAWGNFNGDRVGGRDIGDLAIGIPDTFRPKDIFFNFVTQVGAVWVVLGESGAGLDLTFDPKGFLESQTPVQNISQFQGARFGAALAAGDFFGHGVSSLVVGEPGRLHGGTFSDGRCVQNCRPRAGIIEVFNSLFASSRFVEFWFQGPRSGVDLPDTGETDDRFGQSLAVGDFDGDEIADLAIGVPQESLGTTDRAGAVHVLYGVAGSGLSATGNQFLTLAGLSVATGGANEAVARFGFSLAAGDFNGDARGDLAIGVPFKNVSGVADAGQVKVIYGSQQGLSPTLVRDVQTWTQTNVGIGGLTAQTGDNFGASLTAWNFGHNVQGGTVRQPTADLAIGIPFKTVAGISGAGAFVDLYGSVSDPTAGIPGGLVGGVGRLWSQAVAGVPNSAESGDHFGASLY